MTTKSASRARLAEGTQVAAWATGLTLLLVAAKAVAAYLRQSPALMADAVHSGADSLAIFASWLGLKLAARPPSERFPFGLYRAETLASLAVSLVILLAGSGMLWESSRELLHGGHAHTQGVETLIVALISATVSFGVFRWEKRVGERLGSQSLLANADESRMDILTSLAVFVGTASTYSGLPYVERVVATMLSLLIIWLGLSHGRQALYALLDASLDPDLEARAIEAAKQVHGVMSVPSLRLRRAGPFLFGVAEISVGKSTDVNRAHGAAEQVEAAVRRELPQVESLSVHVEPHRPDTQTVMVPVEEPILDSRVAAHFGRAGHFLFATVTTDGVGQTDFIENASQDQSVRAGLSAIKDALQERQVDVVLTRQIGEIAFHALRDSFVEVYESPDATAEDALQRLIAGALTPLSSPTHASEGAGGKPHK